MTIKSSLFLISLGLSTTVIAQNQDYPPNPMPGSCYYKCNIPDEYELIAEQMLVKPESEQIQVKPTVFKTITEQVLVKEAYKKLEVVPAVFEMQTVKVLIKPETERTEPLPHRFKTVTEQIEVMKATTKWVKKRGTESCLSQNPDDCIVWCLIEVPAIFQSVPKQIDEGCFDGATPAPDCTRRIKSPALYEIITKQVLVKPAQIKEIEVAAEYKTITKTVIDTAEMIQKTPIPAEYKTITYKKMVRKGGMSEWRHIVCCLERIQTPKIQEIQNVLKAKGYFTGKVDNILDAKTKAALVKFQKDNGLPIGSLDLQTLKALGVSAY